MIEIILAIYLGSLALSLALLTWHYLTTRRQWQSVALTTLNHNLASLGLFWSHAHGNFASPEDASRLDDAVLEDQRKALKNILWLSLLAFASLPGFLLLTAVILSVRYLARSRLETAVMASPLTQKENLPVPEVQALVKDLNSSFGLR